MHPATTIQLANMRRDDLLRSGRRFSFHPRNTRSRKVDVEGARS
jgi:hypothetical protein